MLCIGGAGRAFVALNFADRAIDIALPDAREARSWRVGLSTEGRTEASELERTVTLAPNEALIAVEG